MRIVKFPSTFVPRRGKAFRNATDVVVDIGAATVVGAAIRGHRRGLRGRERQAMVMRLKRLAAAGDHTASLVHRHVAMGKPGRRRLVRRSARE